MKSVEEEMEAMRRRIAELEGALRAALQLAFSPAQVHTHQRLTAILESKSEPVTGSFGFGGEVPRA